MVEKLLVVQKKQEEYKIERKSLEDQLQNHMLKTNNLKIVADQYLCDTLDVPHSFWTLSERNVSKVMKRDEEIKLWTQFIVDQSGTIGTEQKKNVEKMVVSGFQYLKNKRTKLKKIIFKKSVVVKKKKPRQTQT